MRLFWLSVCLSLLFSFQAQAQTMTDLNVVVQTDRVTFGPDFIPRRTDLSSTLIVPVGTTTTLPTVDTTYDYIEVSGILRVSRAADTTIRFTHMIVLPGGLLDAGTVADPIPCGRKVELIVRNIPIDLTKDPFQWGNGLVNFGRQTRVGCEKTSFLDTTDSLQAGATTLTLTSVPSNWTVGDELLIPDTDKPVITGDGSKLTAVPSRREARVTIAGISGAVVTLSKPLDFEHLNITDVNGVVVLHPRVANLTRNIALRSDNWQTPTVGTRGHTVDIGMSATWDIRANQFVQLGRTQAAPLDDFAPATGHNGTNQRGKYAEHHHHVDSCPTCIDEDNVYLGNPQTTKWALALHATADVLVKDNVGVDFPGAIFVTEDGYEVRNTFTHNFAAYSMGIPGEALGVHDDADIAANCPGCSGAGWWLRGVKNSFTRNEAWNNFRGIDFFNQSGVAGVYPSGPALPPDTAFAPTDAHTMIPIVFDSQVTAANVNGGVEIWATHTFPDRDLISAYNATQEEGVLSDGIDHLLIRPTLICKPETGSVGITAGQAYSDNFHVQNGGKIIGCAIGIHGGGGKLGLFIDGPEILTLQNEVNIDQAPSLAARFANVQHVPLGAHPHQFVLFDNVGRFSSVVWAADDPLPDAGNSMWLSQTGSPWRIENWQGTGQNYLLLHTQSRAENPAWYSAPDVHSHNVPVAGLTMQQSWDTYGMSWGGDVLKAADAVTLDGVVNAFGRAGFGVSLSTPRAVVTFPTLRQPAVAHGEPNDLLVNFSALATGDLSTASDAFMLQVDGKPPLNLKDYVSAFTSSDRSFNASVAGDGLHTVKVWLTQKANPTTLLVGSDSTSQFCTGATCQTTVPAVKGLTVAYGTNALTTSMLVAGTASTQAPSDTIPAGMVVGSTPAAGTTVAQQSVVNFVLSSGPSTTPPPPVPVLSGISIVPSSVVGGTAAQGTVTLDRAAPTPTLVGISSSSPSATVPSSVSVATGQSAATFAIATKVVTANTAVTITGALGATKTATLTVTPPPAPAWKKIFSSGQFSIEQLDLRLRICNPTILNATHCLELTVKP